MPGDTLVGLVAAQALLGAGPLPAGPSPGAGRVDVRPLLDGPLPEAGALGPVGDAAEGRPFAPKHRATGDATRVRASAEVAQEPARTAPVRRTDRAGGGDPAAVAAPGVTGLGPLLAPAPVPAALAGASPVAVSALPLGRPDAGAPAAGPGSQPFYFERNWGQAGPAFDYVAHGAGYNLGLRATEADIALPAPAFTDRMVNLRRAQTTNDTHGLLPDGRRIGDARSPDAPGPQIRMQFLGGNPVAPAQGLDPLVTRVNYFQGSDPSQWHTNVPTFGRVRYQNVYRGVDVAYYASQGQLEYDFTVAPGSDPGQIRLAFSGADTVTLDAAGDLVLQAGDAQIVQRKPVLYQKINGARQEVAGQFVLEPTTGTSGSSLVRFDVGTYDRSRPLVIDPLAHLAYSTYLGGPNDDYAFGVAADKYGSAYLVGSAFSGMPQVNNALPYGGGGDAYVAKFSPDGSSLVYATYVGGQHEDDGDAIALDKVGGVYITGFTESGNFPTTPGAFQPLNGDGTCDGSDDCADAFVTRLSPDGASLVYSTYLGTNYTESGEGIAVDAAGNAYVLGDTNSSNFYVLNAVQPNWGGGLCHTDFIYYPCFDDFVTKLNPNGTALVYSTYLGGYGDEAYTFHFTGDIAVDPAGQAYVTGHTPATDFPTYHALQPAKYPDGSADAFLTKLSPDGSSFVYSTYLGGEWGDEGYGVAADAQGNAYVTGVTWSAAFPTTPGSFQPIKNDNGDAFACKVTPDGSAFVYSTFLGGSKNDQAWAIAVDAQGDASVTGWTESANFPTKGAFQPAYAGSTDGYVAVLTPAGDALLYASYLGGNANDGGLDVALDPQANAYVVGVTSSTDFPTVKPFQAHSGGHQDDFLAKVATPQRVPAVPSPL
jgi:hypothetical protein